MRSKIVTVFALALLAAGCRNNSKMQRGQQSYETVQEGSAAGVTSTISGPGETPPPANMPMTGTNADTTTAFTLPATATDSSGSMQQPGSLAGTMPAAPMPSRPRTTVTTNTAPPPRPRETHSDAPVATDTVAIPQQTQPATTTHEQQTPPPATDTAPTTQTQTQTTAPEQQQEPPTPPPPATDTTSTKPPTR